MQGKLSTVGSVAVEQGEVVPVEASIQYGDRFVMRVPVGAYVRRGDRMCFVATVDVVGLAAVIMGIYTGLRTGMRAIKAVEAFALQRR